MELSRHLIAILNAITFVLSIPILGAGIWLAGRHHTDCIRFLQGPVIVIGLFVMLSSIAGFAGSYLRIRWLLWIYLAVMFLLIVLLFCFTVFSFSVTNKGAGEALSGKGYKDYKLGDYSTWLQRKVRSSNNWNPIKSCIKDAHICESLGKYKIASDFYEAELSSVQSGCCKPPTACSFLFINATYWTRPLNVDADPDCYRYSYVQSELCFDCDSCKAGVVDKVRHDWRKVAAVNIVIFFLLIVVYSAGCHSFRRSHEEGSYAKGII
ncbi:hypothetical protein KP509_33G027300 [Ceratopteris richardii]|uniref:Uncharacterized protein n=1 Tax=Ceratopteris richardii TaxID=49495 RepID=A0A8T2QNM7_CERRI|nr:hypothetical protein KP509_33G027300 [Ceratopteris richardii]KAH7285417.1 hypothetical protein KP509_33G027300 [Ceratopteris richardii]